MGTVGINFGSATSGAGFNVTTTVASIVANLKSIEAPWNTQLATLKAQDTAFTSIGSDLSTLSTSVVALTDFEGVLASKEGSSSDTNVLSLSSAGTTAVAGSHTVVVGQLAQTSSVFTGTVSSSDTLSGGLTIRIGTGAATTIPVVSGTSDTLTTYAAAINAAGIGVSASVISDTTGSRLSLVSQTSGLAGQLTVTASAKAIPASTAATGAATTIAPTTSVPASNTFTLASASDQLSGTFSYAVGGAAAATVNLGTTPLSLSAAAAALNADSGFSAAGLTATISGADLVVTGTTGTPDADGIDTSASALTTTTPASSVSAFGSSSGTAAAGAVAVNAGLSGQDAQLTVDGVAVDSASNTISTAIPGVTFQLLSAAPGTQVQVQIANDNTDAERAFSTFVNSYNAVVKDIKTQEGTDASGNAEPLFGNTVISQLQSSLSLALTSGAKSGSISSLDQLGISVNNDGTLALDNTTLDSALNSNFADVVGFMQNTGSFGQTFSNAIDNLGSESLTGSISLALAADKRQETTLNDDLKAQDAVIATQSTTITNELNLANEELQSIPQQLTEVNELYSALTGYNNTASG